MLGYHRRLLDKDTVRILVLNTHSPLTVLSGMTETVTALTFPHIRMKVSTPGSGGQLLHGNVARVLKPDGTWAGYNESGELIVRGPSMALCYLNNEQACVRLILDVCWRTDS